MHPDVRPRPMTETEHTSLLNHVFPESLSDAATAKPDEERLNFRNLSTHLRAVLAAVDVGPDVSHDGRLGPAHVQLDPDTSQGGSMSLRPDRLAGTGQGEFTTVRANCCVFAGSWMFEVYLRSKGVMQLGWATNACQFSRHRGVGDTPNSFAFDGCRVRKWNVRPTKYGQEWTTEDVISCAIDCSAGNITFYRNGHSMGQAFCDVRTGPGFAYFPTVSISDGETVELNFGSRPFIHPIEGYSPLQATPFHLLSRARILFDHWDRLLPMAVDAAKQDASTPGSASPSQFPGRAGAHLLFAGGAGGPRGGHFVASPGTRSLKASCWLIGSHVVHEMAPLITNDYVIDSYLLPFLVKFCDWSLSTPEYSHVHAALDMLWAFLEKSVLCSCLQGLSAAAVRRFTFSPALAGFAHQKQYLFVMLSIIKHRRSRAFLLRNSFSDETAQLLYLMHLPEPRQELMAQLVPVVCWSLPDLSAHDEETRLEAMRRSQQENYLQYMRDVQKLMQRVEEMEEIQVEIFKCLLTADDSDDVDAESSRATFCRNFRRVICEGYGKREENPLVLPPVVLLHIFHLLLRATKDQWNRLQASLAEPVPDFEDLFIPVEFFCAGNANHLDVQRVGGLISHLRKVHKDELSSLGRPERSGPHDRRSGFFSLRSRPEERRERRERRFYRDRVCEGCSLRASSSCGEASDLRAGSGAGANLSAAVLAERQRCREFLLLTELLDGLLFLFYIGGYQHLVQTASLRESMHEYARAMEETRDKLARCPRNRQDIRTTLEIASQAFHSKLQSMSRQQAWAMAAIFSSQAKRDDLFWLLRCLLATFAEARQEEGLFSFIPDFYVEATIRSFHVINSSFAPNQNSASLPGYSSTMVNMAQFLARGFTDPRIVTNEAKDSLLQSLACFACYPASLQALEAMPTADVTSFVRALLAAYEDRAWAQTNWILVRLWKGCGFAFRYTHLPYVPPSKSFHEDISKASHERPCPSQFYQVRIQVFLQSQPEAGTEFVRTLLQQANWAFSEFVGALQELQQVLTSRGDFHITDMRSRQMRICRTCFEIAVGLLRVIEMIAHVNPEYFLDWTRPQAETFASRLFQLLCQILNRISARGSLFEVFVQAHLSGLESVGYFPILTAVTGILVQLLMRGEKIFRECAFKGLINDPSFQMSSLEFLLSSQFQTESSTASSSKEGKRKPKKERFCLTQFKEVSPEEVAEVEKLIDFVRMEQHRLSATASKICDDELCSICYALPISAVFRPCGHRSCKSCITFQMINKPECFYCKAIIKRVEDSDGKEIRFK